MALMRMRRRVGVTAPSHKAIHNLLEEIERVARDQGLASAATSAATATTPTSPRSVTPG